MMQEGFHAVETVPGIYRHAEWDVTVSCHGDDFLPEGCSDGLDRLDAVMTKDWRSGERQSGPGRTTFASPHQVDHGRIHLAGGSKVCSETVADMGLTGTKGVDSPASKETGKGNRDLDKPLPCTCHWTARRSSPQ